MQAGELDRAHPITFTGTELRVDGELDSAIEIGELGPITNLSPFTNDAFTAEGRYLSYGFERRSTVHA